MKHPKNVEKYVGSLDELAKDVGSMSYDYLAYFLQKLGDDFMNQSKGDRAKGRIKLASQLETSAKDIYSAKEKIQYAWDKYCKKRMS